MRGLAVLAGMVAVLAGMVAVAAGYLGVRAGSRERAELVNCGVTFEGQLYPYVVYLPPGYSSRQPWPLAVFLHGRGESGTDGQKMLSQGLAPALEAEFGRWPAVVLFPQKPSEDSQWEEHEGAVVGMLEEVRRRWRIDASRIDLTGLSQGGHGTWVLGARLPQLWAALVPVCGFAAARGVGDAAFRGSAAQLGKAVAHLPVWAFHGEDDDVIPAAESRALVTAHTAAGGSSRLTLYPEVGRNLWERAYREPELAPWLLSQTRGE